MFRRPDRCLLNPDATLAEGCVLAPELVPRGWRYNEGSLRRNFGQLTNMDPRADRKWSAELGRAVLRFGGVNQYVLLPSTTWSGTVSLSVWVNRPWGTNTAYRTMASLGYIAGTTANQGVMFLASAHATAIDWKAGDIVCFGAGYGSSQYPRAIADPGSLTANSWHQITAMLGPTVAAIYLDGELLTPRVSEPALVPATTGQPRIGASDNASQDYNLFDGLLADALIHNRVLTPAEISDLADPSNVMLESGNGPLLLPERRVLWPVVTLTPAIRPWQIRRRRRLAGAR